MNKLIMYKKSHISVCVCTFKRPNFLKRLLHELEQQEIGKSLSFSVVVVDNDVGKSAQDVVTHFCWRSSIPIRYYIEPEQSIALARNKAVGNADGDFIAFIDDDEFPNKVWLFSLYNTLNRFGADGVLGPVLPHYETKPPSWVIKGRFFERSRHRTGHVLDWKETRTGNALVKRGVFSEREMWFDPKFGSGGEDRDFFRRKIKEGRIFIWCNEAPVYESIPPERWKRSVLLKRALLRGKVALNAGGRTPASVMKSSLALFVYTMSMPLLFFLGHHIFMKCLIKECDHLGKILALLGIDLVKKRYVTG